ncbi:21 kDa protein-like [Typha angustifolia]|uniref:21 kDa protein-like n=1 Tax=Typha angustifolia TaxID=59011 RepID=UPI003C2B334B
MSSEIRFFLFFFFLLLLIASGSARMTPALPVNGPAAAPLSYGVNSTELIRASCSATRYPRLCFSSLSSYAGSAHLTPGRLAWLAADLVISRLGSLSARVAALRRVSWGREAAALRDCRDAMGDAADLARRAAGELDGIEESAAAGAGPEVAWRVANAQTWLSAALTNEDTCADGFEGVAGNGEVKGEVCARVRKVKQFTSNALALVNSLVHRP